MRRQILVAGLMAVLICGCGAGKPQIETVSVTGKVRGVEGRPVTDGMVFLRSIPTGEYAPSGTIDAEGGFTLATVIGDKKVDGAPPGDYTVTYAPPSVSQDVRPVQLKKQYKIEKEQAELLIQME